jgi:hypothetical protein
VGGIDAASQGELDGQELTEHQGGNRGVGLGEGNVDGQGGI